MEKVVLELTIDEVIMLQELSSYVECGSEWQDRIAESLNRKAMEAYRKPVLPEIGYHQMLQDIRNRTIWPKGAAISDELVKVEETALRFYYRIGGDEE